MIPARRGQNLLDFLTTDWYNKSVKSKGRQPQPRPVTNIPHYDWIDVVLHPNETEGIGWLEPALLLGSYFTPGTDPDDPTKLSIVGEIRKPTEGNARDDNWVIMQNPIAPGGPGRAVVHGITWAKFDKTDPNHEHVYLDTIDLKLKSGHTGNATIISHTVTTGVEGYGLIRMGTGASSTKIFWADNGVTARGSASFPTSDFTMGYANAAMCKVVTVGGVVKIRWTDVVKTIYNMDPKAIPVGTLCRAIPIDGAYVVEAIMKDVRVNGLNLELNYSPEGTGWVPWHTGSECV